MEDLSLANLSYWGKRGGFAILDQGFFAGANFLLNILLARWLEPAEYGAFTLAYSLFLLLGAFHTAILTEPMMVFGAGKYAKQFEKYLGMLIYGHFSLMLPICFLLTAVAFIVGSLYSLEVQWALLGSAVSAPMLLLLWLMRRAFYAQLQPFWAVVGGGLHLVLLIGATYLLWVGSILSQTTALLAMGISALVVSLVFIYHFRIQWEMTGNPTPAMLAADHWKYGRWALGTAGLMWIPGNIYFVLLPNWVGLEGVAALRALMNLVMPLLHAISALSLLILSLLASQIRENRLRMARTVNISLLLFLGVSSIYILVLIIFKTEVLRCIYANKYREFFNLIPIVALLPLGASLVAVFGCSLKAMRRSDRVFWCYVVSCVVAIGGGVPLAAKFGVQGALWGLLGSSSITGTLMLLFFRNLIKPGKR